MEEKIRQLEEENRRMTNVLRKIAYHHEEIQSLLDGVMDLLEEPKEYVEKAHITENDVKSLLKKYSRL